MKKTSIFICLLLFLNLTLTSFKSHAWGLVANDAEITNLMKWENASSPLFLLINNDKWCYVPASEKELIAYVMTLYVTKTKVYIHCRDEVYTYGTYPGHRVHRIVTK